ncbi:MAG: molybdopterin-dependent oxidoreductase, partial [Rhodospirillales bacterium]|nr:molybdopterin-dependent oxidoreductase [Rhodospirillales bacterium]
MAGSASLETHPGLDQWIEITEDERILVHTGKVDIGQRISTALSMIAAEELDVDYDRIDIKRTETGIDPNEGFTAGSMSMMHSGNAVRHAAATARARLLDMAADELGAERDSLEIDDGLIQAPGTNRSVSFWELAGGKPFEADVDIDIPVKAPAGHSVVGRTVLAKGMTEIVSGKMDYLHDLRLPGMKFGRLVRPPHYRASLKSLDAGVGGPQEGAGGGGVAKSRLKAPGGR